jgi:predicted metal-dependent enzyme (double-stranded beta helix superfamily)
MSIARLREAVIGLTRIAEMGVPEAVFLERARPVLADLLAHDDWLPGRYAQPSPERYQQYLLHCDPLERLSIVSFVWGPGQGTPVHNHGVWGMVGVLRGVERSVQYTRRADGSLEPGEEQVARPGDIAFVSPSIGDIHQVFNAAPDQVTVSIHVYGGNIGRVRRNVFDPSDGSTSAFVSRYGDETIPNIWNE